MALTLSLNVIRELLLARGAALLVLLVPLETSCNPKIIRLGGFIAKIYGGEPLHSPSSPQ